MCTSQNILEKKKSKIAYVADSLLHAATLVSMHRILEMNSNLLFFCFYSDVYISHPYKLQRGAQQTLSAADSYVCLFKKQSCDINSRCSMKKNQWKIIAGHFLFFNH